MSDNAIGAHYPLVDVWREILGGIFSNIGRMAALSSCFNPQTGRYSSGKLEAHLKTEEADQAMRLAHELIWSAWMHGSLEQQHADVLSYLRDLSTSIEHAFTCWLDAPPLLAFAPISAPRDERELFATNVGAILTLLQNQPSFRPASAAADASTSPISAIDQVVSLIHERYSDPHLSLKVLSRMIRLSERHLARLFKEFQGQTFRQYLRDLRINQAAHLLVRAEQDVKMIAGMVGYSDRSHFSRDFRVLMGCAPLEFRRKSSSTANNRFSIDKPRTSTEQDMSDLLYRKSVLSY